MLPPAPVLRDHRGLTEPAAAAPRPARLVELNHVITAGMTTYPGLPGPEITPHMSREESRSHYAPGTAFGIDRISMVGNTGTDLAGLPLAAVADMPVVVVHMTERDGRLARLARPRLGQSTCHTRRSVCTVGS